MYLVFITNIKCILFSIHDIILWNSGELFDVSDAMRFGIFEEIVEPDKVHAVICKSLFIFCQFAIIRVSFSCLLHMKFKILGYISYYITATDTCNSNGDIFTSRFTGICTHKTALTTRHTKQCCFYARQYTKNFVKSLWNNKIIEINQLRFAVF